MFAFCHRNMSTEDKPMSEANDVASCQRTVSLPAHKVLFCFSIASSSSSWSGWFHPLMIQGMRPE